MKKILNLLPLTAKTPGWQLSLIPVALLLVTFILIIIFEGPMAIAEWSPPVLLVCAAAAFILALSHRCMSRRSLTIGLRRGAAQILPAVPILVCIAALSTSWMLSGVVPVMVDYGLLMLSPTWFLVITCVVCSVVSVLTGSSWSTIATIGVAFLGIGTAMGYSPAWIAGAIISGAYFGDKVSPMSDTTVLASTACGVDLFSHIRYMMYTTIPAMGIALIVFGIKGFSQGGAPMEGSVEMLSGLHDIFNITPWVLIIPAATMAMIALRINTIITLCASTVMGLAGALIFQPQLQFDITGLVSQLWTGTAFTSPVPEVEKLLSTGGISGIMRVVYLVLAALVFGSILIGTGMLSSLTAAFTRGLRKPVSIVSATVASGMTLGACTADQYLSIIISGNMYRPIFRKAQLEPRLLSRSIEDGVSAFSAVIPWSSCGVTQSAVLGVPTLVYLPYCVFNYLTPLMSVLLIATGYKIKRRILSRA